MFTQNQLFRVALTSMNFVLHKRMSVCSLFKKISNTFSEIQIQMSKIFTLIFFDEETWKCFCRRLAFFLATEKKNIFCPPLTMVTAVCSSFTVFDAKHESAKKIKVWKNRFLASFVDLSSLRRKKLNAKQLFERQ